MKSRASKSSELAQPEHDERRQEGCLCVWIDWIRQCSIRNREGCRFTILCCVHCVWASGKTVDSIDETLGLCESSIENGAEEGKG